jgi:hypothetical protein
MSLTVHQLALRLAKHIGVTAFDPGDVSNVDPLLQAGMRDGDVADLVAAINGALQELWELAPRAVQASCPGSCPAVNLADVGAVDDPGVEFPIPKGWEESVVLPLALQRLSVHPNFQPEAAKPEIAREAAMARRILQGLVGVCPTGTLTTVFR